MLFALALLTALGSRVTPAAAVASSHMWYLPWVANNYGNWFTRVQIQNNSGKVAALKLDLYDASGALAATQSQSDVPPYAWATFDQQGLNGLQANRLYSAAATGSGDIVATVVGYTNGHAALEYTGQPLSQAQPWAFAPGVMYQYDGWNARVIAQNLDKNTATIYLLFGEGCPIQSARVAPHASALFYTPDFCRTLGTNTGVLAYTTTGQKVAMLMTQTNRNQAAAHIGTPGGSALVSIPRVLSGYYNTNTAVMCAAFSEPEWISIAYGTGQKDSAFVGPFQAAVFYTANKVPAHTITTAEVKATAAPDITPRVSCYVSGSKGRTPPAGADYSWAYNPQDGGYPQTAALGVASPDNPQALNAVQKTDARWYLNWSRQPLKGMPPNVEFVPMSSGTGSLYLMGTNEPNRGDQDSKVCPWDYVPTWHQIEQTYGTRGLVSPGVAGVGSDVWCEATESFVNPSGAEWLTQFRTAFFITHRRYPRFEVLGYHTLGSLTWGPATVYDMTTQFERLASQWDVRELWLDEYDSWSSMTPQDLREALDWLATRPRITRIGYYQDHTFHDTAPLVDSSGKLTAVGRAYWLYR